jgi:hypothetical protein
MIEILCAFLLPTNSTNCFCYFLLERSYNTITFDFMRVPMSSVKKIDLFISGRLVAIFYVFLVVVRYGDILLCNGYLL